MHQRAVSPFRHVMNELKYTRMQCGKHETKLRELSDDRRDLRDKLGNAGVEITNQMNQNTELRNRMAQLVTRNDNLVLKVTITSSKRI